MPEQHGEVAGDSVLALILEKLTDHGEALGELKATTKETLAQATKTNGGLTEVAGRVTAIELVCAARAGCHDMVLKIDDEMDGLRQFQAERKDVPQSLEDIKRTLAELQTQHKVDDATADVAASTNAKWRKGVVFGTLGLGLLVTGAQGHAHWKELATLASTLWKLLPLL